VRLPAGRPQGEKLEEVLGEITQLRGQVVKLEDEKVEVEIAAAITAKQITPAEKDSFLVLAKAGGESLLQARKLIAARAPGSAGPPGAPPVLPVGPGTTDLAERQHAAVREYMQANPGASYDQALITLSNNKPDLFKSVVGG
jgi:hypothetical protein